MKAYFAVTNNPTDDVNPFTSYSQFIPATVGELNWGFSDEAKNDAKMRFSLVFNKFLLVAGISLTSSDILSKISDDDSVNKDIVLEWVALSKFPV